MALTLLAQVQECITRKDVAKVLKDVEAIDGDPIRELCRYLCFKRADWKEASRLIKNLQGTNSESIRYSVVGYVSKVILDTKDEKKLPRLMAVLSAFCEPYPSGVPVGVAPIILSVGEALYGN
jgi:adenylylsulfate kinase-like enzyme